MHAFNPHALIHRPESADVLLWVPVSPDRDAPDSGLSRDRPGRVRPEGIKRSKTGPRAINREPLEYHVVGIAQPDDHVVALNGREVGIHVDNAAGPRFAYTGQIALPEAQLYHYEARVYDP